MRFNTAQLRKLANAIIERKDFTIYAFDNESHAGRYIVGGLATDATLHVSELVGEITGLHYRHADLLVRGVLARAPHAETLGVWVDPETGTVHIDAGDTYTVEPAAMQSARNRGELAIYDRLANAVINA